MKWLSTGLLGLVFSTVGTLAHAEEYDKEIILTDLNQPMGITTLGNNRIFFTEVPTPGVFGGKNTVKQYNLRNGRMRTLSEGEPEPLNLAANRRHVYWSCRTAGVVLSYDRRSGEKEFVLEGLASPTGLALGPFGSLFYTQVPTPGVPGSKGGENTVDLSFRGISRTISEGEPEPTDIVVDYFGTAYWTCKSAGVILRKTLFRDPQVLLEGLEEPTGISLDRFGRYLYYTEIPTPGVPGDQGGTNRVVRYDLFTGDTVLVSEGEPEPSDVAVANNGNVYWTCTTAGVIIKATPR